MTPPLSTPPYPYWLRAPRALVAGMMATALCLAGCAWLARVASHRSSEHQEVQPAVAPQDALSKGFSFGWPEHLVAAGMFHCTPVATNDMQASVVVWTDKANNIVAFGVSQEGVRLPAYAAALEAAPAMDANQRVHVAAVGHVLRISKKGNTLQFKDMTLDCIRTWDD